MRLRKLPMFLLLLVVVSLATSSPVAYAQASAGDDARAVFERARSAYEAGDFESALQGFQRAYVLSGLPALLYNIGQSQLRLGRDALALEAFEAFLRSIGPDEPNRPEVEERVRVLRQMGVEAADSGLEARSQQGGAEAQDEEGADAAPPTPDDGGGESEGATVRVDAGGDEVDLAPVLIGATGGALVVAGAVMLGVAAAEASRVSGATDGDRWADLQSVASTAEALWIAGFVVGGVGLAAAALGLVLGLTGDDAPERAQLSVGPGGITLSGAF